MQQNPKALLQKNAYKDIANIDGNRPIDAVDALEKGT